MCLKKPSLISTTNGDGCIFLSWSSVINAIGYEIELEIKDTGKKTIYYTTSTSFLINELENERFYSVQVTALNKTERSESSIGVMLRPKLHQYSCTLKAAPTEEAGRVFLQWTFTPTDFGFQIERCDINGAKGYKRIGWLPYNTIMTYEDKTDCDLSTHTCLGHYYTVTFRDTAWRTGAGLLSKKVFCMSSINPNSDIQVEKSDVDQ